MRPTLAVAALLALLVSTSAQADILNRVFFAPGSARMDSTTSRVIGMALQNIANTGASQIVITGRCDPIDVDGSSADADKLSLARAQAVAEALRQAGLPASVTITVVGAGLHDPPHAYDESSLDSDQKGSPFDRVVEIGTP